MNRDNFVDFRCTFCQKLLFRGELVMGKIETKCRNCRTFVSFTIVKPHDHNDNGEKEEKKAKNNEKAD